jgi:hypothetical protein
MTDEEFRTELLASSAARAEVHNTSLREGFVMEVLERLREAGEAPEAEICAEILTGPQRRRLEIDAHAFDEADDSLHLFITIQANPGSPINPITLTEARDQGFSRLTNVYEQARDGWLSANIEESRPLAELANRIRGSGAFSAVRLHVLTDRPTSERLKEIPQDRTKDDVPITFQIWDTTRLRRIHDAVSVRDDLVIDLTSLPGGGLPVLPASLGENEYDAYLAVVPAETLSDIYIKHGSRLLEGNVRTFLGRRGNTNKGMLDTLGKEPERFFAYNNGIAATASEVEKTQGEGGLCLLTGITDLQIVNGAQTTATLASLRRDKKLPAGKVFVPMKLSVVVPSIGEELIPRISKFANRQNSVRDSDFFANHPFHRRMETLSRRILAPALSGSLTQTHWYYERARGQYLNDQAGKKDAQRDVFVRQNPRQQVITKTDMAKVESCFDLLPDVACKGAEKAFTAFAERMTKEWTDESRRSTYGDDWFRAAVARNILFQATEKLVSNAPWYGGGYRSQIVAYTLARLSKLASDETRGGTLDFARIWSMQAPGTVLEQQLLVIAEVMARVLRSPVVDGQNISEWAKQQACRTKALEAVVPVMDGLEHFLVSKADVTAARRDERDGQRVADGLEAQKEVLEAGSAFWRTIREFATGRRLATQDDLTALSAACVIPRRIPTDWQSERLLALKKRCEEAGFGS